MGSNQGTCGLHNIMVARLIILLVICMAKKVWWCLEQATWIVTRRPCVVPKDAPVATRGGGKGDMLLGAFWRRFHEADLGLQQ